MNRLRAASRREDAKGAKEEKIFYGAISQHESRTVNIREYTFVYRQELDLTGLMGCAMSSSYVLREGTVNQQLISGLQELYQRFRFGAWFCVHGLLQRAYTLQMQLKIKHGNSSRVR